MDSRPLLSVIVPCFNEQEVIEETHKRLSETLTQVQGGVEIIYVNDGSRDRTVELLFAIQARDPTVRVISLSRNFGHQLAVTAGMDAAAGEAAVLIDADLQDPPAVILEMVELWRQGYDVVYGTRSEREGETSFKRVSAKYFYRILNMLSEVPIPLDTGDFRLVSRQVLETMKSMREYDRFVRGMVSWVGYRQIALPYKRAPRFAGVSKYPFWKMVRFAGDGILSFSIVPLRLATWIGVVTAGLGFLGIFYALVLRLFTSNWVSGWTLLFIAIVLMGGIQLVMLGVLGEYIGRLYRASKNRPLYVVGDRRGFGDPPPPPRR
ncbi:MAG: glycosyltransferase family 2 protein [Rhizomicrobium sp.]